MDALTGQMAAKPLIFSYRIAATPMLKYEHKKQHVNLVIHINQDFTVF